MIFVTFSAIIYYFHDYFATWNKYFATWDLFRASGALPLNWTIIVHAWWIDHESSQPPDEET